MKNANVCLLELMVTNMNVLVIGTRRTLRANLNALEFDVFQII